MSRSNRFMIRDSSACEPLEQIPLTLGGRILSSGAGVWLASSNGFDRAIGKTQGQNFCLFDAGSPALEVAVLSAHQGKAARQNRAIADAFQHAGTRGKGALGIAQARGKGANQPGLQG